MQTQPTTRQLEVYKLLPNLRGLEPLKTLFWTELGYERVNQALPRNDWTPTERSSVAEDPILFAKAGNDGDFHVIYVRLQGDRLRLTDERPIVSRLLRGHPYALFVFSNRHQDHWHFVNVKHDPQVEKRRLFRRITIGPEERLRTASERLALLDIDEISRSSRDLFGLSPLAIQQRHDEAFDVEAVTKKFFDDYKAIFSVLQNDLHGQTHDREWAHDYALQFLNRCMFLYFVQRKRWLGDDTEFLKVFWKSYQAGGQPKDTFFEAFNNKFHGGHRHFPKEMYEALALAPFLNGGLFSENDLDRKHSFAITDALFTKVFNFLELYNFTIAEDSPLDQEVAVDPEMIGKVYESLVNVSEVDERGEAGIFYTPRTEIDLMCRLTVVDHLANHLGHEPKVKNLLYEAVFALEPGEKVSADKALTSAGLWPKVSARLRGITVVDPACGSGSFLVGMLMVLDDLQERANKALGGTEHAYDRKRRIIGQSLYGVDVMEWAVHVAELRLWLALTIDAEFTREELHTRSEPLLPYFTFKIRRGDSLVQEIGGINLAHIRGSRSVAPATKARLTRLKNEKLKFYNNDPARHYRTNADLRQEELSVFRIILDDCYAATQDDIASLQRRIAGGPQERQMRLDGTFETESPRQLQLQAVEWQRQLQEAKAELQRIERGRSALRSAHDVPFVWDIAFVEIFEGDEKGFDIVVGNPPYVRQESIADPNIPREEVTTDNKKLYKAKLARSVYHAFPTFFGYNETTDTAAHKIDAKSDLYIYFYFHSLSLLNPKGSFCFITSNSWLDVGYGADLQEFLLRHAHVKMVIDNQAKRSFISADVNTVIALFSPPASSQELRLEQVARFIMFTVSFEHALSPIIFEEVEAAPQRRSTPEYRVHPIVQLELLLEGLETVPEPTHSDAPGDLLSTPSIKTGKYLGNQWGGKYLRAPEIYWTIIGRNRQKLISIEPLIGRVVTVGWSRLGRNSDIMVKQRVPGEELVPVLKSPREFDGIVITAAVAKTYLRVGLVGKNQLIRTPLVWDDIRGERHICRLNQDLLAFTHNFHGISINRSDHVRHVCACLNSTFVWLIIETLGRRGLGGGGVRILVEDLKRARLLLNPDNFSPQQITEVASAFGSMCLRPMQDVRTELGVRQGGALSPKPDRLALDKVIFDVLALSDAERGEVYRQVIAMVESRVEKADSLNTGSQRKTALADGV